MPCYAEDWFTGQLHIFDSNKDECMSFCGKIFRQRCLAKAEGKAYVTCPACAMKERQIERAKPKKLAPQSQPQQPPKTPLTPFVLLGICAIGIFGVLLDTSRHDELRRAETLKMSQQATPSNASRCEKFKSLTEQQRQAWRKVEPSPCKEEE